MIKLRQLLIEATNSKRPDKSLDDFLLATKVHKFTGRVYHGSPVVGLKEMLLHGIGGSQHGEVAEYDAFSTSINAEVLGIFSEADGISGLEFYVDNARILVADDIIHHLMIQLAGSGMEVDVDNEVLRAFCEKYNVPFGKGWGKDEFYLPYNYVSSLGVDGFAYDYTWKALKNPNSLDNRDEHEICFVGNGNNKLNQRITTIYVDGAEYDISEKEDALAAIDEYIKNSGQQSA